MNTTERILVVEDDQAMQETCCQALRKVGYDVRGAASPKEAEPILLGEEIDLVVTDLKMPHGGGQEVLRTARQVSPQLPVILITAYPSVQSAVDLFKSGLVDYLTKPFTVDQLRQSVRAALQMGQARDRSELLRRMGAADSDATELLGSSPRMRTLLAEIRRVSGTAAHVLISGEPGSGKESVARTIHRFSPRSARPFVALNCASVADIPATGEVGTWTKALEQAAGGSLFLDEVSDLPTNVQAKLLGSSVREGVTLGHYPSSAPSPSRGEGQKEHPSPLKGEGEGGGDQSTRPGSFGLYSGMDIRIMAATFKDLRQEVRSARFREDVYHHLSSLEIHVPPLREHLEDVPALAVGFLDRISRRPGSPEIAGFSEEAIETLAAHSWPGNVRELENVVRKAVARAAGPLITKADVSAGGSLGSPGAKGSRDRASARDVAVTEYERKYITSVLSSHGGNVTHTAKALGVHRTTLQRLMKKHAITGQGR